MASFDTPTDILYGFRQFKYDAYFSDVAGLVEAFRSCLPLNDGSISLPPESSAQLSLASLITATIESVESWLVDEANDCTYDPDDNAAGYGRVTDFLKKLYRSTSELSLVFIASMVLKIFPTTTSYAQKLQQSLDRVAKLKTEWVQGGDDNEICKCQIRGMIMLLLNCLPKLFLTNEKEIAAWKTQHLADLYTPPSLPSSNPMVKGGTVSGEWERYKSASKSVLESLNLAGNVITYTKPVSSGANDDDNKSNKDGHDSVAPITRVDDGKSDNDRHDLVAPITTDEVARIVQTITESIDLYVHFQNPSSKLAAMNLVGEVISALYDFSFADSKSLPDIANVMANSIYVALSKCKPAEIKRPKGFLNSLKSATTRCFSTIVYARFEAMGPKALVATKLDTGMALRLAFGRFKRKKPRPMTVPWGTITVKGSGSVLVIDDGGHVLDVPTVYAPGFMSQSCVIDKSVDDPVLLLEDHPAIIPVACLTKGGYTIDKQTYFYDTYTHRERGTIYLVKRNKHKLLPLRQLPQMTQLIEAHGSLCNQLISIMKERTTDFEMAA